MGAAAGHHRIVAVHAHAGRGEVDEERRDALRAATGAGDGEQHGEVGIGGTGDVALGAARST